MLNKVLNSLLNNELKIDLISSDLQCLLLILMEYFVFVYKLHYYTKYRIMAKMKLNLL